MTRQTTRSTTFNPLNTIEILIAQSCRMFATNIADRLTSKTAMRPSLRELVDTPVTRDLDGTGKFGCHR